MQLTRSRWMAGKQVKRKETMPCLRTCILQFWLVHDSVRLQLGFRQFEGKTEVGAWRTERKLAVGWTNPDEPVRPVLQVYTRAENRRRI